MFFGLFLGPVLALVLFNTVVFVIVLRVLIKHYLKKLKDIERKKQITGTFKTFISVVSIMFMFGLQWLFGAFTIAEASEAFQWLFVIFSTLQGLFLFLYFCVMAQDAREQWLNLLSLGKRKMKRQSVTLSRSNTKSHYRKQHYSSNTLKMNISSSSGSRSSLLRARSVSESSTMEIVPKKDILLALPASITEERDTEFELSNGNVERQSRTKKKAANESSAFVDADEEQREESEDVFYDAANVDFGDDFTQLLHISAFSAKDFSHLVDLTSYF